MVNLRSVDLNLLTIFEAVYEERSQVRAAQRIGMTQPAISNALARLRLLVGDRLFQGRTKGLVPTGKADALYEQIHSALSLIRAELDARETFDPETTRRRFVVATSVGGGALVGTGLYHRFRALAPDARLTVRSIDPEEEIPELLREQRLDLAVHHSRFDDSLLEQAPLMDLENVVIARRGHPRVRPGTGSMAELLRERFAMVYEPTGFAAIPSLRPLVETLRERVAVEVPSALLLPFLVAESDLLAIVSLPMARMVSGPHGLFHFPLPRDIPSPPSYLIWHRSLEADPAHAWLRQQVLAVAAELRKRKTPPGDPGRGSGSDDPTRIRTAVAALKGPSPGPLDDGVGARKLAEEGPRGKVTRRRQPVTFLTPPGQTSRSAAGRSRR